MKQWFDSKYGKVPFQEVVVVSFKFSGPKNREETAETQYHLLLKEEVLQAHLEYSTGFGKMVLLPQKNPEQILKEVNLKYSIESRETISYEALLDSNNQF
jgi:hypothetical protein